MTSSTQPQATDQQIIERLATEVMGWKQEQKWYGVWYLLADCPHEGDLPWDPLTDWNHWRDVEIEACRNFRLWHEFMHNLGINTTGTNVPSDCSKMYVRAPLMNRCLALLSALDSSI